jgi:hypothetical protein
MCRATRWAAAALACALAAGGAAADTRGSGSRWPSTTTLPTKNAGTGEERAELPARDLPIEPSHGLLGAPGAAPDQAGPSRLGPRSPEVARGAEAPEVYQPATDQPAQAYGTWKSGDRVRSASSADVRSARGQQAPDLEWASTRGAAAPGPQPGARAQPPQPYGVKAQAGQKESRP